MQRSSFHGSVSTPGLTQSPRCRSRGDVEESSVLLQQQIMDLNENPSSPSLQVVPQKIAGEPQSSSSVIMMHEKKQQRGKLLLDALRACQVCCSSSSSDGVVDEEMQYLLERCHPAAQGYCLLRASMLIVTWRARENDRVVDWETTEDDFGQWTTVDIVMQNFRQLEFKSRKVIVESLTAIVHGTQK